MGPRIERVVIVGAGQAGFQTALSLRQNGFAGSIALVGDENRLPYQRPPLSKAYLKEGFGFERLELRPDRFFADNGIELRLADPASAIRRADGKVRLRSGTELAYDRLVLATGARNRPLPGGDDLPMLRSAADAEALRSALAAAQRLVVIGGGFIGLEVAASAASRGVATTVLEAGERLMARVVSPAVSAFFDEAHRAMGTRILLRQAVRAARRDGTGFIVETDSETHRADLALVAIGVAPNDDLARDAGLETNRGILVDRFMTTDDPHIFAVGDCAVFESRHARGLVRLESVQNAVDQAKCAAARIGGGDEPYDSVPWFWSDQGTHKLQIAGIGTSADHWHAEGSVADGRLIVHGFQGDELAVVETVNRPGDHMAGRRALSEGLKLGRAEVAREGFDLRAHVAALGGGATPRRGAPA